MSLGIVPDYYFNAISATLFKMSSGKQEVHCKMCCRPLHSVQFHIESNNTSYVKCGLARCVACSSRKLKHIRMALQARISPIEGSTLITKSILV